MLLGVRIILVSAIGVALLLVGSFAYLNLPSSEPPLSESTPLTDSEEKPQQPQSKETIPSEEKAGQLPSQDVEIAPPQEEGDKQSQDVEAVSPKESEPLPPPQDVEVIPPEEKGEEQLGQNNSTDFVSREVLIGLKQGVDIDSPEVAELIESNSGRIKGYIRSLNVIIVEVEPGYEEEFIEKITLSELVEYAELNYIAGLP